MRGDLLALQLKCHAKAQKAPSDIFRLLFPSLKILLTPLYSIRFYAPVKQRGICFFEVTICDLKAKERKRKAPVPTVCFYRRRCNHVVECLEESKGDQSQYRDHEGLCALTKARIEIRNSKLWNTLLPLPDTEFTESFG